MLLKKINIWYLSSFLITLIVAVPIITVFTSFFETTGNYSSILRDTFLYEYVYNSIFLLIGVLFLTFVIGVGSAYIVSFYKFPGVNFFKWSLCIDSPWREISLFRIGFFTIKFILVINLP